MSQNRDGSGAMEATQRLEISLYGTRRVTLLLPLLIRDEQRITS
ncbi:hypothetical protein FHS27_003043 [Rhodopirellula rubra]|uniref:Uncharacterized protein n=1 Tax=Aporhodopirellula rubra TaxID=980271 RepID=A0A7W5DZ70_9BACT|nr:hypothetical protein [Aporhodopirellula rubra]MBB3207224.1 hypothetical protein [Aporhodopirellula rubra]